MSARTAYYANLKARRTQVLERAATAARPSRSNDGNTRQRRFVALGLAVTMLATAAVAVAGNLGASAAPVGQGFTVTPSDLDYILRQIKVAEHHALTATAADPCAGLLGTGPDQIPSPLIGMGLRTVDGSCNNLQPGQATFGTADKTFPRLTTPVFKAAEPTPAGFGPPKPTSYAQNKGLVFDSQPRVISNLISDQTSANPAAVAAAGFPVRTQGNTGVVPCTAPSTPVNCVPAGQTLFIPNVTTDIGLSPPYNSLFTIFGQFFDHGLDKVTTGGSGTVFVPLHADDPLIVGVDGIAGTADDPKPGDANYVPPSNRFMVLTRGTQQPGPDGLLGTADDIHESINTDSPWVDLSQAYGSHSSHQVFLREYEFDAFGHPASTGRLLGDADGSLANWADVKAQTATMLGLKLVDTDVNNIPMIAADPYGNFIPGPNGLPQYVTALGLVEGNLANPVPAPANVRRINTAFLNDISHAAAPVGAPDPDTVAGPAQALSADCGGGPTPCYDNELLDLHVIAGDGRANENIGLTSIHTIFEHEHNRLVAYIQNVLDQNPALHDGYLLTGLGTFTYGERLFQAARFVTEMEYQHLVFEEFARKVQPAINPFNLFAFSSTATDPAIKAEFAHAVYRFGHSMLNETIPRTNVDGSTNDIALLDGFLNPAEFKNVTPGDLAAAGNDMGNAGAGAIVMGLSDQVGNELDEFVSDTLRNNLLGLPLDLASLNLARARSEGVASLNNVRRDIYAQTNDGQLIPYTDWVDFGSHLKHPESLINFVAAYGTHPTILAETTTIGKRNAARAIVNPAPGDVAPSDAADFMFSTGAWAHSGTVNITGLDDVDLWIGGLAENTELFGGLLGSTFNYIFSLQMTQLQDADRLYYLNRTPGMNLRTQLEGNSFAELIMRNTTATGLKADAFGTADCKFEIGNITSPAAPGSFITGAGSVNDDPKSPCNENRLLIKAPNGQIKFRSLNSVNTPGINSQSVYNGSPGPDRIGGGNDTDTISGFDGNDILEGNGGPDRIIGGNGNDIITDTGGDDVLKGGPGNDAIDGGPGLDILLGGDGSDLMAGGGGSNTHFGGPGDDFILGGDGADVVQGDSGNDWMEGGEQADLLQGDSGSLFFDDHNKPGNDIMIGQGGDDDYDMEGGDDIGVAGPGIEKNAGAAGWDWSTGVQDPQPQDADLNLPVVGLPLGLNGVRDRFNEVESLSGGPFNDILRGDSVIPETIVGIGPLAAGFIGCDALDQAGVDRISGLAAIMPPLTTPSGPIIASAATIDCPLVGNVWGKGNILLGGGGSDLIEGRGGDDIIDGDRYLNVRLSVRTDPTDPTTEIGTTDIFEHTADAGGSFGAGTAGMTLQQAVFAGLVDPGNVVAVREILTAPAPTNGVPDIDTAVFNGPAVAYMLFNNLDGSVTVTDGRCLVGGGGRGGAGGGRGGVGGGVGGGGGGGGNALITRCDGVDTLRNIENLQFSDITVQLVGGAAPNSPAVGTISFTPAAPMAGVPLNVVAPLLPGPNGVLQPFIDSITDPDGFDAFVPPVFLTWEADIPQIGWLPVGDGPTFTPTAAEAGMSLRLRVDFVDYAGNIEEIFSDVSPAVAAANQPATGAPVVTPAQPTATVEVVADISSIADPDGLATPLGTGFAYQWQLNGVDIVGANAQAFTPDAQMVGSALSVTVSFTDLNGSLETLSSTPSSPIVALPQPVLQASAAALNFGNLSDAAPGIVQPVAISNIGEGFLLVGNISITGVDAGMFTLTLDCNNATIDVITPCGFNVAFSSATLGAHSADLNIESNAGATVVIPMTVNVVANTAPTGAPALSTVSPTVDTVMTSTVGSIDDADGLVNANYSFQWQAGPATGAIGPFTDIVDAIDPTFIVTPNENGRRIRVVVSFSDDILSPEVVTGSATAVIGVTFVGTAGNNVWAGTSGDDVASGSAGNDTLAGNAGNDTLAGDSGNDTINGGAGNDVITFTGNGEGFDSVNGGANVDTVTALADNTVIGLHSLSNVEAVNAGGHVNVTISGGPTADTLHFGAVALIGIDMIDGGGGNDNISGSALNDVIRGGAGNDTLTGGNGDDVFVYFRGDGSDVINNFDAIAAGGQDRIDLTGLGVTAANFDTQVTITRAGSNVRIIIGNVRITLSRQTLANITIDDFIVG
ncbi:MAG: peroxidase family protein [Actinomycetota bacterium]